MTIRAVIFDLDGVLTDTAEYHYRSWQRLTDEEGIPFDRETNEKLRGLTRSESLRVVLNGRQISGQRFQEYLRRKNEYYHELLEEFDENDLLPGIPALLDELEAAGIPMAVGSSSRNVHIVLETLNIAHRFEVVAGGGSVEHNKPAPDIFLQIATQLDVAPDDCVVIEDSEAGVEAALRGGFRVIGVGPAARVGDAHLRVDSTTELMTDLVLGM